MGLTSSRGKRPARLHSSMIGMRLSSMNLRVVSRTSNSSSVSRESNWMKSTPRNLMAGMMASPWRCNDSRSKATNRFAARGVGRVPEGKHMTVAGARERGQRKDAVPADSLAEPWNPPRHGAEISQVRIPELPAQCGFLVEEHKEMG